MKKLVVCIIILAAVCCAQEHLTCLRTDDVSQRALQGSPGKQGPKGQMGSRGSPGQKGEPGVPDNDQINLLRNRIDALYQEVEALRNQNREIQQNKRINSLFQEVEALKNKSRDNRKFLDVFSKGLYVPPHVYIYLLTPGRQSWHKSQQFCQNWGGTLAVLGVKTLENRKKLIQNLPISNVWFWIGANDIASEGNWVWLNGERASSSELIWQRGQPDNQGGNQDCVIVRGYLISSIVGQAIDDPCSYQRRGLCEKQI